MSTWRFFPLFIATMLFILLGVQTYFYLKALKLSRASKHPARWRKAINVVFLVFNIPTFIGPFFHLGVTTLPWIVMYAVVYPYYVWHVTLFFLFLIVMIGKLLKLPFVSIAWIGRKLSSPRPGQSSLPPVEFDSTRRKFVQVGATVVTGAAFSIAATGTLLRNDFDITYITIPIKNLPTSFQGYAIGLLSDIHSSIFMTKPQMQRYVQAANSIGVDLMTVTGDFVNSELEEVYPFAEAFVDLKGKDGIFGVLGNHDFYTRHVEEVAKEVNQCGIRLLRGETVRIHKNGEYIDFMGVDDVGFSDKAADYIDQALRGTIAGVPKILMCHRPYYFQQAEERKIDLILSGHTHGGQIVFGRIGRDILAPARLASPYVAGLYTRNESQMYVSRGIGTVAIPIRINCSPEITKITLVRA